jgi:hypothetical protein
VKGARRRDLWPHHRVIYSFNFFVERSLLHVQHQLHIVDVGTVNGRPVPEIPLALRALFGQNVAFVGMFSLDLAGSGKFESLLGTGIGFHFWHFPTF